MADPTLGKDYWDSWRSKDFADATIGKFQYAASLKFWKVIAKGEIHEEEQEWVQLIAKRIIKANDQKGSRRAEAILKAVGLSARDKHAELRELVQTMDAFDFKPSEMLKFVRQKGLAEYIEGDDALREIIRRELKK